MNRNTRFYAALIMALALFAALTPPGVAAEAPAASAPGASAALSASEVDALHLALQDEYKALATYEQVMADFGAVRPFTNIARAEAQHIAALGRLFDRYGLEMPANEWLGQMPSYDSVRAAAEAGVQAEVENAALYEQLNSMVAQADILQVFDRLSSASANQHLRAFERVVARR